MGTLQSYSKHLQKTSGKANLPPLLLATQNVGKVKEIQGLLEGVWPAPVMGMNEVGLATSPEETSGTFEGNAAIKAEAACAATGHWALADDSGLCVDVLAGAPGVDTAHYGGYLKLVEALHDVPIDQRTARFVCVLALARPNEATLFFTGVQEGHIAVTPRGEGGFGYDPAFVPSDETRTFAEMSLAEKARHSHRAKAFAALTEGLQTAHIGG